MADAKLARESDIPLEAVRVTDLLGPLADTAARARLVMLDAAHPLPFLQGRPLARGLAAVGAPAGMLVSYSTGPGTIIDEGAGPYSPYATAIAEMIRAPGLDLDAAFVRVRTRTHQLTQGLQTPWHASALGGSFMIVPATPDVAAAEPPPPPRRQPRPMRGIDPDEAYALAIESDSLPAYVEFVEAFPRHPYSARIWAIIRARREALAWERALEFNTPQAYWTYMRRYPHGVYAWDAELRLRRLSAALEAPQGFMPVEFADVPMPLEAEPLEYVAIYPAAPPPPMLLIAPPPEHFRHLAPPPVGRRGFLPAVASLPVLIRPNPRLIRPMGLNPATGPKPPFMPNGKPVVAIPPGRGLPNVGPKPTGPGPVVNVPPGNQFPVSRVPQGNQLPVGNQQKQEDRKPAMQQQQQQQQQGVQPRVVAAPTKPVIQTPVRPVVAAPPKPVVIQQPPKPVIVDRQPAAAQPRGGAPAAAAVRCPPGKQPNGQGGCK
jgi:uncharacterized caspase-like protein